MNSMDTPRTREEFERNFNLLHRQIADGKFHVAQGLSRALDGLAQVRFLPNGRIDFLSVDEMARLQANMMNQFDEESFEELLKEDQVATDVSIDAGESGPPIGDSDVPSDLGG